MHILDRFFNGKVYAQYSGSQASAGRVPAADVGQSKALSHLAGQDKKWLHFDSDPVKWNYMNCVPLLKNRPVLVLKADDHNTSDNQELASRLRKAGDAEVTEIHMHTDHTFSDHRIAMQGAIVNWLGTITKLHS